MPRKAKDNLVEEEVKLNTKKPKTASSSTAKTKTTAKKDTAKKAATKKDTTEKAPSKKAASKKVPSEKETTKKTAATKKTTTKTTTKAATTKKTSTKKTTTKKKKVINEYYDLPATYNQTIVKILAQTPTILFVYWDVSEEHKQDLMNKYGEYFFYNTTPFLVVTNETKNYSFEVEINDYANSWYLHIPDSDCKYDVALIRRAKNKEVHLENNVVSIASSNKLETPNDHILFERLGKTIFFKNVKNNVVIEKNISTLSFINNIGRIYNVYDLYKEIYKDELNGNELGTGLSSSNMSF